jgi:dTDP-4-dehydrorhamnose 3,5-epimerase
MSQPVRDVQTVTPAGERTRPVPDGVHFREMVTQVDERGTLVEMYDPRWGWHPAPLVYAYCTTIRPGMIKGWAVHRRHDDRYFILFGEAEIVLYDERPESPTRGLVATIELSEHRRRLMSIPAGVWHAERNLGQKDVVIVNFPTIPYDHASPDKYRLPLDTDRIPYRFPDPRGW